MKTSPRRRSPSPKPARRNAAARMPGTRCILVPVDFSRFSEKAVRHAVEYARQSGGKIVLLHVQPVPYYPAELGFMPASIPAIAPQSRELRQRLDAEARRLVPPELLDRTELRTGTAFHEICTAARRRRADLIILATHGYTGLKHVLLGSTAERVVRHAPCAVLTVR